MGGGLMQLVAVGAQDVFLTSNPQITFFKVVYRRHTNFSNETIKQVINGSSAASGSGNVSISRNGDLVHRIYVTAPDDPNEDGDNIINSVEVEIGGQKIDKHVKEWNQIWAELNMPEAKAAGYKCMTGNVGNANANVVGQVQVPLNFWFCRNAGLALPLIALQYHEVKLKCEWGSYVGERNVHVDYIYLDTDERRRFAQVSHEYLIEQVQDMTQIGATDTSVDLHLNHPVKELIWTSPATNAYETARVTLNGQDRFENQQEEYFQLRQPLDHHTAVPGQNVVLSARPQMLNTPVNVSTVMLTTEADTSPADGGMAVVANVLYLHSDEAQSSFAVGDVLHIKEMDINADAAAGFDVYATITVVTSTTQFTLNSCPNTVAGNWGSVSCVARAQDPLARCSTMTNKINVYSFALKPEEHQPSGTCNFSRIDTAQLKFGAGVGVGGGNLYAVNYNILRIQAGMGGLAYSN
jgi:hypothetical protein